MVLIKINRMGHGGKRPGSGRKPGSLTARTREVAERALAEGKAPLEVMLDNMRHFQQVALDAEAVIDGMNEDHLAALGQNHEEQFKSLLAKVKQAAGLRIMAHECARDAAGYMHARLSSVALGDPDGKPLQVMVQKFTGDAE